MSYIRSKDAALYYEEHGSGEPLILLPGLLGTIESHWRRFIPDFAQHYHVIAVDLRGHGRTNNPSRHLFLHTLVSDVFAIFESLQIDSAKICGYSLGGYVGLAFGIQHPGTVNALMMHGTKFYWTPEAVTSAIKGFDAETIQLKNPVWAAQLQQDHALAEDEWRHLLSSARDFTKTLPAEGLTDAAIKLADFPVMVSVGDADEMIPNEEAERLSYGLPYGFLKVFPNTKHPLPKVDKKTFVDLALSFFASPETLANNSAKK
jgi:pimeloyl-ACP methyl ester carboxylesterase